MLAVSSSNHRQRSGRNLADGHAIPGFGLLLTTWHTPTLGFRKQERMLRTGSTGGCLRSIAQRTRSGACSYWIGAFTVRCSTERGCVTVCRLSIRLSVMLRCDFRTGWNTSKIILRPNSLRHLLTLRPTWAIYCNENTLKIGLGSGAQKPAISPKRCKIGSRLLWRTNRKLHTCFRLVPKSITWMTLNSRNVTLVEMKKNYEAYQKNLNEHRFILWAAKCRPMILVSRNIKYLHIFVGVPHLSNKTVLCLVFLRIRAFNNNNNNFDVFGPPNFFGEEPQISEHVTIWWRSAQTLQD